MTSIALLPTLVLGQSSVRSMGGMSSSSFSFDRLGAWQDWLWFKTI